MYFAQHDGPVRGSRSVIHKFPPKLEDSAAAAAWTRGTSSRRSAQQMSNLQLIYLGQRRFGLFLCAKKRNSDAEGWTEAENLNATLGATDGRTDRPSN